jgi:hypothetical protein
MPGSEYALLTITPNCINRGNYIIEYATMRALGIKGFKVEVNAHQRMTEESIAAINACRALILPGATLLQPEDHLAVESIARVKVPILAVGSALRSIHHQANFEVVRHIKLTIGSRDPFTHDALSQVGVPSQLVGCPTLLLNSASGWRQQLGPIVFSPGLGNQQPLHECALACADVGPTVVLLHAPDRQPFTLDAPRLHLKPLTDAESAFQLIQSASVVVTSRIHALLCAIIYGVPAIFLGGWYDSRYSLVEYLGVPIEPPIPSRIKRLIEATRSGSYPPSTCFARVEQLRESLRSWLKEVGAPLGIEP